MASSSSDEDDREAARVALNERAWAYVENLEIDREQAWAEADRLRTELELTLSRTRDDDGMGQAYQEEMRRGADLVKAIDSAMRNLEAYSASPAATTMAAVKRTLRDATTIWLNGRRRTHDKKRL